MLLSVFMLLLHIGVVVVVVEVVIRGVVVAGVVVFVLFGRCCW